jgi:N-acetylmuramoyl-L-alanine amidase
MAVMDRWKPVIGLLAAALTGCGTPGGRKGARATDWESPDFAANQQAATRAVSAVPSDRPSAPHTNTTINQTEKSWMSLERWCQDRQQPMPVQLNGSPAAFSLNVSNGSFVLRSGNNSAYWEGSEVRLGFAPQFIDGRLFVHGLDFEKTIDPLIAPWALPTAESHPVIVIDPGHGGSDPGAQAAGTSQFEKDLTLDWALRLARLLAANGWQVLLTRTNDSNLVISNRVAFAETHHADLFISLHFNSSAEGRQQGVETYCLTPAGMQSTITRGEDDTSALFPNNAFDAQNLELAYRVHSSLVRTAGSADRGVRRARFPGVLRNQNRPAILVEGGYISSRDEAGRISDPAFRQIMAQAVAKAICGEPRTIATADPAAAEPGRSPNQPAFKTTAMP